MFQANCKRLHIFFEE